MSDSFSCSTDSSLEWSNTSYTEIWTSDSNNSIGNEEQLSDAFETAQEIFFGVSFFINFLHLTF